MILTREQAIAEHRKMWRWIAEEIESKKKYLNISDIKYQYFSILKMKIFPIDMCFLCQYANEKLEHFPCRHCPVEYPDGIGCLGGLYYKVNRADTWQEQAALARQIAELPEREDI